MVLTELVKFAQRIDLYKNDESWIKEQIIKGIQNNTVDYVIRYGKVVAFVRYNIINDGRVADILDLIIDENGVETIRYFVRRGLERFPTLKFIRFERGIKYPERRHKIVEIEKFL